MSALSAIIEDDFETIYSTDEAAEAFSYLPKIATAATTITGFIQFETDLGAANSGLAAFAKITIRTADVASPAVYDKITHNGREFEVLQILGGNKHNWLLYAYAGARQVPSNLGGV